MSFSTAMGGPSGLKGVYQMKKRLAALALLAAAATLPAATASAANDSSLPPALPGKPLFLVGPKHNIPAYHMAIAGSSAQIPQWNGSYTDLTKQTVNFTQVGGNPHQHRQIIAFGERQRVRLRQPSTALSAIEDRREEIRHSAPISFACSAMSRPARVVAPSRAK